MGSYQLVRFTEELCQTISFPKKYIKCTRTPTQTVRLAFPGPSVSCNSYVSDVLSISCANLAITAGMGSSGNGNSSNEKKKQSEKRQKNS